MSWAVRGSNPGEGDIFRALPDSHRGPNCLLCIGCLIFPGGKAVVAWCKPGSRLGIGWICNSASPLYLRRCVYERLLPLLFSGDVCRSMWICLYVLFDFTDFGKFIQKIATVFLKTDPKQYKMPSHYLLPIFIKSLSFRVHCLLPFLLHILDKFSGQTNRFKITMSQCLVYNTDPYTCYIPEETHFSQTSVYLYQNNDFFPVA
jgi:hypothetical protein